MFWVVLRVPLLKWGCLVFAVLFLHFSETTIIAHWTLAGRRGKGVILALKLAPCRQIGSEHGHFSAIPTPRLASFNLQQQPYNNKSTKSRYVRSVLTQVRRDIAGQYLVLWHRYII